MIKNLKDRLARFMHGRYGTDQLHYGLFVVCLVLAVVNSFVHNALANSMMSVLLLAVLFLMLFRTFSRNINQRRQENEKFKKLWNSIKGKFSLAIRRIKEIRTHRFRQCPACKTVLRLPRKTGKHTVKCPCCHKEFKVRITL